MIEFIKVEVQTFEEEPSVSEINIGEQNRIQRLCDLKKQLQTVNAFELLKNRYLESLEQKQNVEILSSSSKLPDPELGSANNETECICEVCGQTFSTLKHMLRHMDGYHAIPGSLIKRTGKSLFKCKFCELEFQARSQLLRHNEREHANPSSSAEENQPKRRKKLLEEALLLQKTTCVHCDVKTGSMEEFVAHLEVHHAGKFCDICYKIFQDSTYMMLHKRVHLGQNPFACDFCPKVFKTLQHVGEHRRGHTGDKPFKCTECPMEFARSGDLNKHKKFKHTKSPSFICAQCPATFYSSSLFYRHKRKHLDAEQGIDDSVVGEFPCRQCKEMFRNGNERKEHVLLRHGEGRPFECVDCGKRFKLANHLKAHALTHIGVKTQTCDECPAAFYLAGDLRRHQKRHLKSME
ncbi:zinc finger protein 3 homolog [Armigeres subalbatus]|uniref:zinc finger protein 3 homolog n=1 Tax=Armigeres subalbatus TaxID=124917 RepID=UPI002ED04425